MKNFVAKGKFEGSPKASQNLIERFKTLENLEPIILNHHASSACYVNLTKNEENVTGITGGAVKELETIDHSLT